MSWSWCMFMYFTHKYISSRMKISLTQSVHISTWQFRVSNTSLASTSMSYIHFVCNTIVHCERRRAYYSIRQTRTLGLKWNGNHMSAFCVLPYVLFEPKRAVIDLSLCALHTLHGNRGPCTATYDIFYAQVNREASGICIKAIPKRKWLEAGDSDRKEIEGKKCIQNNIRFSGCAVCGTQTKNSMAEWTEKTTTRTILEKDFSERKPFLHETTKILVRRAQCLLAHSFHGCCGCGSRHLEAVIST